jgi:hypothetical protein
MARSPRTRFAASFVVCFAAAGCSHEASTGRGSGTGSAPQPQPKQSWRVEKTADGDCATVIDVCDRCNPPAPQRMTCPPNIGTDPVQIVTYDGTHCVVATTGTPVGCPSDQPPPPPPPPADAQQTAAAQLRHWAVDRRKDGTCWITDDPCAQLHLAPGQPIPPCNPPPPTKIDCPPNGAAAIVETAPGTCVAMPQPVHCPTGPHAPTCNPPPPMPVTCPVP